MIIGSPAGHVFAATMIRRDVGLPVVLVLAACSGGPATQPSANSGAAGRPADSTTAGGSAGSAGAPGSGGSAGTGGQGGSGAGTGGVSTGGVSTGGASTGGAGTGGSRASSDAATGDTGSTPDASGHDASSSDGPPQGDVAADAGGPVAPVMRNGRWAFDLGEVSFEVDPQVGGRVAVFRLGTENLLTGPDVNPTYWGSTFWTSPESQWSQPPPVEIDSLPYIGQTTATSVILTGQVNPALGVSITKTFSADRQLGAIRLEYKITNQKQAAVRMAPWEVTRVPARGLTFYPTGARMMLSAGATLPTTNSGGVTWFAYDNAAITNNSKLYADGTEGWLAHVAQGLVFIKSFPDVPTAQQAPGEGDIELFTNAIHTYLELENQGAYGDIASQASSSWTVLWFLRRLPAGIPATAGNAALAQFVRDTIKGN